MNAIGLLSGTVDAASGGLAWLSAKATLEKTDERALLPKTQSSCPASADVRTSGRSPDDVGPRDPGW